MGPALLLLLAIAHAGPSDDLDLAVYVGDLTLAVAAIDDGAAPQSALGPALVACDGPMVELLVASGAQPDGAEARRPLQCPEAVGLALVAWPPWGEVLLREAAGAGELARVEGLLAAGVAADGVSLEAALAHRRDAVAERLLRAGAPVGAEAVAAAARAERSDVAERLVRALPREALDEALVRSASGAEAVVRALVRRGAGLDATWGNRGPALVEAAASGSVARVELLLGLGAPVDGARTDGRTPLMVAGSHPAVVRHLLAAGADPSVALPTGWTALHEAARQSAESVDLLLEAGAPVDATMASSGETPLHQAARAGRADVVERLLAAGADPSAEARAPGAAGADPAALAAAAGHDDLALRLAGAVAALEDPVP